MSINLEQNKIFNQIKEILWSDWDPIGVNDCGDARDEYTSYALQIFGMKIHNADKQNIADRLYNFEMVDMEV